MAELQTERSFVVELTPEGVQEIQSHKNIYTEDTKPIPLSGREWSTKNYITLWTGILVSIPVYMMASALLSAGLTWYQALFICVLGHTLVLIPSILLGKFGSRYGASFPVLSKMVFGPKGTAIPTIIRAFMGCLWFGIQNWIGGTALDAIITVIFPAYTGLAFHSFLSFGLFVLINFYIGYHGSRAIRFLEDFAAPILIILSGVVIVWAFWLASQKGGFAALFTTQVAGGNGESFWSQFFPSLTSMIAFDATIALNFSDYTRHAKTEGAQVKGQLIGAPIMTAFIVFVGSCGTTTIVDHMAFGPKGCSLWHQVEEYHRLADGKAVIDYGFHGVLQHVDERVLREMGELADREGITSFKAYLTYDDRLDDGALFQVLRQAKEDGIVIPAHCENDGVVNYLRGWYKAQGLTQPIYHARSRPARCEAEAVSRLLHLAAMAGEAPVYVVHLSSAAGLAEVRKARAQRQKGVGVETCTQYLTLTEASYADPQEGLKAVMSPPLRTQADCDALWQGLQDGVIDAVATDHCPFHFAVEKQFGAGDFTACPNGAPGVEERLPVLYSEGVAKGRLSICELVRLLCANPSRLYGLYPRKGTLQPGADADVVILDPAKRRTLTHAGLHSAVDYTCYEGMELQGAIDLVLSRGEVVARDNQFVGKRGAGRYLKRGHSILAE